MDENRKKMIVKGLKDMVKEGLWALSNMAAAPPFVLDHLLRD
jgi:stress-induced morphogen